MRRHYNNNNHHHSKPPPMNHRSRRSSIDNASNNVHQAAARTFNNSHSMQANSNNNTMSPTFYHPPAPTSMPSRNTNNANRSHKRQRSASPSRNNQRNVRRRVTSPAPVIVVPSPPQRRTTIMLDREPSPVPPQDNDDNDDFQIWFGPDSFQVSQPEEETATLEQESSTPALEWEEFMFPSAPSPQREKSPVPAQSSDDSDHLEFYESRRPSMMNAVVVSSDEDDDDDDDKDDESESDSKPTSNRPRLVMPPASTISRPRVVTPPSPIDFPIRMIPSYSSRAAVRPSTPPLSHVPAPRIQSHLSQPRTIPRIPVPPQLHQLRHHDALDHSNIPAHQRARIFANRRQQHNRHRHSPIQHDPFVLSNSMLDFAIPPRIHTPPVAPVAIPSAPVDTSNMTPQELTDYELARRLQEEENAAADHTMRVVRMHQNYALARWRQNNVNNNNSLPNLTLQGSRPNIAAVLDSVFLQQRHRQAPHRHILLNYVDRDFNDDDYEMLLQLDETVPKKTASTLVKTLSAIEATKEHVGTSCVICMCDVEVGENLKELPLCKHTYHAPCIDKWLSDYNNVCPICKQELM